jgi:hypothetical protein
MREPILKLFFARTRSDGIFRCAFARIFNVSVFLVSTSGDIRARFRRLGGFSSYGKIGWRSVVRKPKEREREKNRGKKESYYYVSPRENRRLKTHTH